MPGTSVTYTIVAANSGPTVANNTAVTDALKLIPDISSDTWSAAGTGGATGFSTGPQTGNIADFCECWGGRYRYMIVFDADSIMTGGCLVDLVRLMEIHPRAGIIQAPPLPVNRHTFFGRMRQFAAHA